MTSRTSWPAAARSDTDHRQADQEHHRLRRAIAAYYAKNKSQYAVPADSGTSATSWSRRRPRHDKTVQAARSRLWTRTSPRLPRSTRPTRPRRSTAATTKMIQKGQTVPTFDAVAFKEPGQGHAAGQVDLRLPPDRGARRPSHAGSPPASSKRRSRRARADRKDAAADSRHSPSRRRSAPGLNGCRQGDQRRCRRHTILDADTALSRRDRRPRRHRHRARPRTSHRGARRCGTELVVALGPGEPGSPLRSRRLERAMAGWAVVTAELDVRAPEAIRRVLDAAGVEHDSARPTVAAPDREACGWRTADDSLRTLPARATLEGRAAAAALTELWAHGDACAASARGTGSRRSSRSCRTRSRRPTRSPRRRWPAGRRRSSIDELGDLLFQTYFLALLCARGRAAGDLADVADGITRQAHAAPPARLRRVEADTAARCCAAGSRSSATQEGARGDLPRRPRLLPGAAVRAQDAAPGGGRRLRLGRRGADAWPTSGPSCASSRELREALAARGRATCDRELEHELGDVLFAAVNVLRAGGRRSRSSRCAPPARRFRARVEARRRPLADRGRAQRLPRARARTRRTATIAAAKRVLRGRGPSADERDRRRPRPPDPRLAGQPDRRGRGAARERRAAGALRCPPAPRPACTRPSSCATAATRSAARASRRPSQNVDARSSRASRGWTRWTSARSTRALIELDGTPNKGRLGANAILGASLAVAHAAGATTWGSTSTATWAASDARTLPVPMMNVDQRRGARGQLARPAGVHARARTAPRPSPRRCRWARRCSTR